MTLDYIHDINEYGDSIVRLFNFGRQEAILFRDAIHQIVIIDKEELDLSTLNFIQLNDCNLTLVIGNEDEGIFSNRKNNFICSLTLEAYKQMLNLIEPFCNKELNGFQYLYDIDTPIDFLFSPSGTNSLEI
jgi:hypothetical protein